MEWIQVLLSALNRQTFNQALDGFTLKKQNIVRFTAWDLSSFCHSRQTISEPAIGQHQNPHRCTTQSNR